MLAGRTCSRCTAMDRCRTRSRTLADSRAVAVCFAVVGPGIWRRGPLDAACRDFEFRDFAAGIEGPMSEAVRAALPRPVIGNEDGVRPDGAYDRGRKDKF